MTASAKAALVPTGTMAVVACCLTAAAFRAFAAASSALADDSASEPFGPLSDAITTVSALVSMSGREAGSGPKTERLLFAALPVGEPPGPAGSASPGAAPSAGGASAAPDPEPAAAPVSGAALAVPVWRGFQPPRNPAMSTRVSSRMSCGRVMSAGRSPGGNFGRVPAPVPGPRGRFAARPADRRSGEGSLDGRRRSSSPDRSAPLSDGCLLRRRRLAHPRRLHLDRPQPGEHGGLLRIVWLGGRRSPAVSGLSVASRASRGRRRSRP